MQSSVRFIPHVIAGISANLITAYLVSRVKVHTLAVVSAVVTVIPPALMATTKIDENYWFSPFWAMLLSPINCDGL